MKTVVDILLFVSLVTGAGGLGIFAAAGFASIRGRFAIDEAFEAAARPDFDSARKAILRAVRIMPTLVRIHDLQKFYDLLLTENPERIAADLARIRLERTRWPKTREENICTDKRFQVFLLWSWLMVIISGGVSLLHSN